VLEQARALVAELGGVEPLRQAQDKAQSTQSARRAG